jgi:hypothetical protein
VGIVSIPVTGFINLKAALSAVYARSDSKPLTIFGDVYSIFLPLFRIGIPIGFQLGIILTKTTCFALIKLLALIQYQMCIASLVIFPN